MKYEKGSFITIPNQKFLSGLDPIAQTVFIWLCFHANQEGECFPSLLTISRESGMGKTSVKKAIVMLENQQLVIKENRKEGKKNMTNLYQIIIGGVGREATYLGREATEGVGRHASRELNPISLTQSTEERIAQKIKDFENEIQKAIYPKVSQGVEAEEIKKFFSYWTEPNKSRTKLKWEMQQTWDTKRRLGTWFVNSVKFNPTERGSWKCEYGHTHKRGEECGHGLARRYETSSYAKELKNKFKT
jgi:hypothetical protein